MKNPIKDLRTDIKNVAILAVGLSKRVTHTQAEVESLKQRVEQLEKR